MKKILFTKITLGLLSLPVLAKGGEYDTPATFGSIPDIAESAASLLWQVAVGLAVIMLIFSGIMFITAGGDPEKITKARQTAFFGVLGIIVAILAFSAVAIIRATIG